MMLREIWHGVFMGRVVLGCAARDTPSVPLVGKVVL
jgi:hypothetical protein